MKNKIIKTAVKYKKSVHGQITLECTVTYAKGLGYEVIFFSSATDEYIKRYELEHVAADTPAFTYNGTGTHAIFINDNISYSEKLHGLLHETGHIMLGHMGTLYLKNNDEIEAEAETFVYEVLYNNHTHFSPLIIGVIVAASLLVGGVIGYTLQAAQPTSSENTYTDEIRSETVYITSAGTKYHRADCRYIKNNNSITALPQTEAIQKYASCSVCKP